MSDRMKNTANTSILLSLLIIAGMEILLFQHGIRWWYRDDPTILKIAISHNFYDMFFSPAAYREMTASNFTPFAFALFRMDYLFFGLVPALFYLHLYIVLYFVALLFYFSCRVRFSHAASLVAVLMFMISRPFLASGSLLMQLHYTVGLFFALSSFLFFDQYMRRGKVNSLITAALFYLIASLCKEIFVPLPFVFLFFPYKGAKSDSSIGRETISEIGNSIRKDELFKTFVWFKSDMIFQRRIRTFISFFFLLFIYMIWREIMLRGSGGYGLHLSFHQIFFLPLDLLSLIGGSCKSFSISVFAMCVCFFILAETKEKIFAVVLVFMVSTPVIPVISYMEIRYALLSALCVAILIGWCFDICFKVFFMALCKSEYGVTEYRRSCFKTDFLRSRKNLLSKVWVSVLIVFCSVSMVFCAGSMVENNINSWLPAFRQNRYKAMVEGRYLLEKGTNRDFIKGVEDPIFFSGLGWLRMTVFKLGHGPRPLFDWFQIFHKNNYRILQYNKKSKSLVVVTDFKEDIKKFAKALDMEKPLKLKLEYLEPMVRWEFGPWNKGNYTLFIEDYYPIFAHLPKKGRFPLKFDKNIFIRLKFQSYKGWVTYSPVEAFNCKNGKASLFWQRK